MKKLSWTDLIRTFHWKKKLFGSNDEVLQHTIVLVQEMNFKLFF